MADTWGTLVMCSLAAAVQGMDETVNNGAQVIYLEVYQPSQLSFSSSA
jgi:hypothetical protein